MSKKDLGIKDFELSDAHESTLNNLDNKDIIDVLLSIWDENIKLLKSHSAIKEAMTEYNKIQQLTTKEKEKVKNIKSLIGNLKSVLLDLEWEKISMENNINAWEIVKLSSSEMSKKRSILFSYKEKYDSFKSREIIQNRILQLQVEGVISLTSEWVKLDWLGTLANMKTHNKILESIFWNQIKKWMIHQSKDQMFKPYVHELYCRLGTYDLQSINQKTLIDYLEQNNNKLQYQNRNMESTDFIKNEFSAWAEKYFSFIQDDYIIEKIFFVINPEFTWEYFAHIGETSNQLLNKWLVTISWNPYSHRLSSGSNERLGIFLTKRHK